MPSALHHASVFFRPLISAAVPCLSTDIQALGAVTCAGAREGEARRREAEPRPTRRLRALADASRNRPLQRSSRIARAT